MANTQASQPDCDAIARQIYEWLKVQRSKRDISTSEALLKAKGYTWADLESLHIGEEELFRIHDNLLRIIKKEKEYVADFSAYMDLTVGLPFNIPFIFRKK